MKKIGKMNEISWVLGNVLCALGVAMCTKANFGLSMLAAPPYILHVVISKFLPWYSQGISEYGWQIILLVVMCLIVRKFKVKYLLSFLTVIIFGALIDFWLMVFGGNAPFDSLVMRIISFVLGELIVSLSVAFYFRSSLAPQMAECLVVEASQKFKTSPEKVKMINDISCAVLSVVLSLVLTGGFTGVGIGTILIAVLNAPLIKMWGRLLDKVFTFEMASERFARFYLRILGEK